jgi:hypothetical protein
MMRVEIKDTQIEETNFQLQMTDTRPLTIQLIMVQFIRVVEETNHKIITVLKIEIIMEISITDHKKMIQE